MNTSILSFHNNNFDNLLILVISHSKIRVLIVKQHLKLESLIADNSALQKLLISGATKLRIVDIRDTFVSSISVEFMPELTKV